MLSRCLFIIICHFFTTFNNNLLIFILMSAQDDDDHYKNSKCRTSKEEDGDLEAIISVHFFQWPKTEDTDEQVP